MRSQRRPIASGSSPTRSSASPRATACEDGISTIVRATYGEVSASPTPTSPSSVWTRTMNASWVPSALPVSISASRRTIGSTEVIFMPCDDRRGPVMKALTWHGGPRLTYDDVPTPGAGDGDVAFDLTLAGGCGSHLH